jgi:hypothetical protein
MPLQIVLDLAHTAFSICHGATHPKKKSPPCDPQTYGRLLVFGYSDGGSNCLATVTANGVAIEGPKAHGGTREEASYDLCIPAIEAMEASSPNVSLTLTDLYDAFDSAVANCSSPSVADAKTDDMVVNCTVDAKALGGGIYLSNVADACQAAGGVFVLASINVTCTVNMSSSHQYLQNMPECMANQTIEPNCTVVAFKRWLTADYASAYGGCDVTVVVDTPEDQDDSGRSSSSFTVKGMSGLYLIMVLIFAISLHF